MRMRVLYFGAYVAAMACAAGMTGSPFGAFGAFVLMYAVDVTFFPGRAKETND